MKQEDLNGQRQSGALYGFTLDASLLVLTTLRNVARVAPVPYLMEAADLALGILDTVQKMKDCREGFKRLASDSCGLVYAIADAQSEMDLVSGDLDTHVKELLRTLQSIWVFSQKELKRGVLLRMVRHASDSTKILEYREALRQALDIFGLRSTVSIRGGIASIIKNQDEIVRHLERQSTQSTQSSGRTQLHVKIPENEYTEKMPFVSSPVASSSFSRPVSPGSKNPFREPKWSHTHPSHTNTLDESMHSSPYYYITGNFVVKDTSHHIKNSNSNNTVTTNTIGSNNTWSSGFYGT